MNVLIDYERIRTELTEADFQKIRVKGNAFQAQRNGVGRSGVKSDGEGANDGGVFSKA